MLDAFCRAELDDSTAGLPDLLASGRVAAGEASMLFLVTGTAAPSDEVQRVVGLVPGDLWAGVFRCGADATSGMAEYAGRPIVTLSALRQLPVAMSEVVR